jgi:Ca2+-dependent lipid-binding protein
MTFALFLVCLIVYMKVVEKSALGAVKCVLCWFFCWCTTSVGVLLIVAIIATMLYCSSMHAGNDICRCSDTYFMWLLLCVTISSM